LKFLFEVETVYKIEEENKIYFSIADVSVTSKRILHEQIYEYPSI
jgi:hypothetical protein